MKKLFTLFVLMAGCFAFAACSDDSGDDSNPGTDQPGGDIEEGQKPIYRHGKVEMVSSSSNLKIIVTTFNVGDTLIVDYGNGYSAEVIADGVEWENDAEGNDREYGSVTLEYSYSASEERTILIEGNMSGLNLNSIHLVSLDLSDCLDIEKFECADLFTYGTIGQSGWVTVTEGELTSLDLSKHTALRVLDCRGHKFTSLSFAENGALENLDCSYCEDLVSLDVSKNVKLTSLYCNNCELTSLDISQNTSLTTLHCYGNSFTEQAMNEIYEALPDVGYDEGGEPKGNMWCDRLGNWIVAEQKGWRLDFDND